ncbi:19926_t:CDS:2 [Dentiscutata erythropus]|uniref:19926_t:CDS:1 n=1 Tax=Dentiscutata erythropus TaxID=1348616 RepID=A0A9N9NVF5_9GLOM|nr:19926_t:CDS:2 [Dentiscutata erythropus]
MPLGLSISLGGLIGSGALTGWPNVDVPPPERPDFTALIDPNKVSNASVMSLADIKTLNCPSTDTYCHWTCTRCVRSESDIVYCPNPNDWGLSFDDGPSQYTVSLLDFLDSKKIKATFFIIGSQVVQYPEILQRIANDGHQIGVHTWSHPYLTSQTTEQVISELQWTAEIIKNVTGVTPKYMRPPYGDYDDRIRDICKQLGYKIVLWDKNTNDWLSASDASFQMSWVESNFTEWVGHKNSTGHISLELDKYSSQGQLVVPILQNSSYNIKPIADCLGYSGNFYKENGSTPNTTSTSTPAIANLPQPSHPSDGTTFGSFNFTKASSAVKNNFYYNNSWPFIMIAILIAYISFNTLN